MADGIKISALTEATDAQTVDGNLLETAVVDSSSSTGFSSKKTPISRLAKYVLDKYTGLSLGGVTRTVKTAIDALKTATDALDTEMDTKADIDGEYDDLVVGTSKQLLSDTYTIDRTPYKYRKSPYTDRLSESIVGCSVAWNQLVNTSDTSVTVPSGHKYLSRISGTDALGESTGTAISVAGTDNVHDLTAMFGTTVADRIYALGADGIKLFRSWYPNDYYPYSANTLEHVSGLEAHDMVGFNQWDEEWEVGGYSENTGAKTTNTNFIRTKNLIPCFGGEKYYAFSKHNQQVVFYFYDSALNYVGFPIGFQVVTNAEVTAPTNAKWIGVRIRVADVSYSKGDICINLSDPTRNGTYKPYSKHSYALDASLTLRGVLKYDSSKGIYADGDVYKADGTVDRRYGIVDLGTLNWSSSASAGNRFTAEVSGIAPVVVPPYTNRLADRICSKYPPDTQFAVSDTMNDKTWICSGTSIVIKDTAYLSIQEFKAAMSGVYLVYPLATPTTESAEPYDAIQITDGTEEYVTDCLAPVGHESKYYANLRSKIEGLPTDFSAIICSTEPTSKASKNYAVGDYLIYGNTLYKVTTAIATDATLTVGTNITATTIMAEIKALQ